MSKDGEGWDGGGGWVESQVVNLEKNDKDVVHSNTSCREKQPLGCAVLGSFYFKYFGTILVNKK